MASTKIGTTGEAITRRNVWMSEGVWNILKDRAVANGLSPSEEITEMILDITYEDQMGK